MYRESLLLGSNLFSREERDGKGIFRALILRNNESSGISKVKARHFLMLLASDGCGKKRRCSLILCTISELFQKVEKGSSLPA